MEGIKLYRQLPKVYEPQKVETKWYDYWLEKGFFHAEVEKERKPFCIVIPPPNVTGKLHLGHALNNTLQDILTRYHRMKGDNALWLPGTDHAGIATQVRVEEELAKEGLSRHELGREEFLKRVWAWKEEYGGTIIRQLKRLGASCDWDRERFTMDEGCSRAVKEVFLRLYRKGLIYRGSYLVNWCPQCATTLSDIEVEHEESEGRLWHIRYPLASGDGYIQVATTRPETMLGDTAVAVHPGDDRYRGLVGKKAILPLMNREIPIVADPMVDREFGTGAVKITPAHDLNDFELGLRHNLPQVTVIGFDARMTVEAGKYTGLDRYEARKKVLADLAAEGLLAGEEVHHHALGTCYRCDTVVEPLISKQWFVRMKPLAEPAARVVREGKIRFVPERFAKVYLNWLENIRDWCISRQLWWGHRVPVWYCLDCGTEIAAAETPEICPDCGSNRMEQDPDVLDTWFSSALWPFSTLGWPENTPELEHFYPTSVLVTARDIIFFWVARMVFMGLEFMEEIPFADVLMHGLVLDKDGKKMSKSRPETIVDPQDVIDEYGADILRFTLATGTALGQDQRFQMERVEGVRNFANKIWNAARFLGMNLDDYDETKGEEDGFSLPDQYILSRLQRVTAETGEMIDRYDLGGAANLLYDFIWNEYCDWYIEMAKPQLKAGGAERRRTQQVLVKVFRQIMVLLHPYMPFITEEIWQVLPHEGESIMVVPWPEPDEKLLNPEAEEKMGLLMEVTRAIRNLRAESRVEPGRKVEAILLAGPGEKKVLEENRLYLEVLAGLGQLAILPEGSAKPEQAVTAVVSGVEVYLPLAGLVDLEKEKERLEKELAELEEEKERLGKKLSNTQFLAKAPEAVVAKEKQKLAAVAEKYGKVSDRLRALLRA
ncbi:MAG TPA: valine--tRNA ligase [Firmicutes bacterium]|nr:valine--tRNA ligase [Bacillota bacterium]